MPITTNYYLNAPTLSTATAVFTDAALTICAPDGYYSDSIVRRRQVGCVLQVAQTCPSCCIFSFTTTTSAQDNSNTACAQPIDNTYYYQPIDCVDNGIAAGDPVFYDSAASIPLDNGWYSIPTLDPECPMSYQVVSGVVTEFLSCCSLLSYTSSTEPFPNSEGVCGQEMPSTYYTNSVTPTLVIGDLVYQDSLGSNILQDGWYITPTETPECPLAYEVSGGVIINTFNCCASLLPYNSSLEPVGSIGEACPQEILITYYTNSATLPYLTVGDLVYQDSGGTNPLQDGWYIMETDVPGCPLAYEVLGGIVVNTYNCCA